MSDLIERAKQAGFRRAALEAGALISDGPVDAGWATHPFGRGTKAHFWTAHPDNGLEAEALKECGERARGIRRVTSACGLEKIAVKAVPLLGAGNLPFCARCEAKLMKGTP